MRVGRPVRSVGDPVAASVFPIVNGGTLSVPVEVGEVSDAVGVMVTFDVLAELGEMDVDDDGCCANTPVDNREEVKRAERSKERFSDSDGDNMVVAMAMSRRVRGRLKKGFDQEGRETGIGPYIHQGMMMQSKLDRRRAAATIRSYRCEGGEWPKIGNWWLLKSVVP